MAQLFFSTGEQYIVQKKMITVGSEFSHDVTIAQNDSGLLFTLVQRPDATYELLSAKAKLKLNGQNVYGSAALTGCDRIEWSGGSAVFVMGRATAQSSRDAEQAFRSLGILNNVASTLQGAGGVQAALHQALDALVEMASAEVGYLLTETSSGGEWQFVASRLAEGVQTRKDIFSNTILQQAIRTRETVYVENIIGHEYADAASVIEARIFSAVCAPLIIGDRTFGAIFLMTRSPGRSIKKEAIAELRLLATQAALLLGVQAELRDARQENARLRTLVTQLPSELVQGASEAMASVTKKIRKLAPTPLSVLILGETGTGKERVARELHRESDRAKGPFIAVNCAAIPATLLESTLFGFEKGAFTGATRAQVGRFAQASGGTIFLDEIGDLSPELQAKLLRVLQEKVVEPLGSTRPVEIDVRVLAATHVDLESSVRSGKFRQDLYFRLSGALIKLPALRERKEDIVILAQHFLSRMGSPLKLSSDAIDRLNAHSWPGNVRELEQAIMRAALLAEGNAITSADLELQPADALAIPRQAERDFESLEAAQLSFTREYVQRMLSRHDGNRLATASRLGISERTLYRILAADTDGRVQ